MRNKLSKAIDKFFHDLAVSELKLQNEDMSDSKFTYNDMLYIDIISAHSGEYTVSKIADMLHVARPSVTQKINELEKMGYIRKEQSTTDKRVYYLFTNEEALPQEYLDRYDALEEKIFKTLLDKYSMEQMDTFCEMLDLIGTLYLEDSNND